MNIPRLLFGATNSGCGKTTIVCGLLQLLKNRGFSPAACKSGPDYIDPMFHREIIGAKSANLDLFFTDEATCRSIFAKTVETCDIAILEGVMGYYDGLGGTTTQASAYHVAKTTKTPAILILDAKGASLSLCATAQGFRDFLPDSQIAGVILNRCSAMQYAMVKPLLENCGISCYGHVPNLPHCTLESRHLGLITAQEVQNLQEMLGVLAGELAKTLDVAGLLALAKAAPELEAEAVVLAPITDKKPKIAVAKDRAFSFYYGENLQVLEELGAELLYFSPLHDETLPPCDGLYFGGGYPELHGEALAQNRTMLESIRNAVAGGLPTFAECGGFMYLHECMTDGEGNTHRLVGLIPGNTHNIGRLARFGYVNLTAQTDTLLCKAGETIGAHEFHYYDSQDNGASCIAQKPTGKRNWTCVHGTKTLFAGYPHLYFHSNLDFAKSFVTACAPTAQRRSL